MFFQFLEIFPECFFLYSSEVFLHFFVKGIFPDFSKKNQKIFQDFFLFHGYSLDFILFNGILILFCNVFEFLPVFSNFSELFS